MFDYIEISTQFMPSFEMIFLIMSINCTLMKLIVSPEGRSNHIEKVKYRHFLQ